MGPRAVFLLKSPSLFNHGPDPNSAPLSSRLKLKGALNVNRGPFVSHGIKLSWVEMGCNSWILYSKRSLGRLQGIGKVNIFALSWRLLLFYFILLKLSHSTWITPFTPSHLSIDSTFILMYKMEEEPCGEELWSLICFN